MKKITLFMAIMLLFMIACDGGYRPPSATNYYVGTKGVVMSIPERQRVTQILENSELYSVVEIKNQGAYGIDDYWTDVYGYLTINIDTFYISYLQEPTGPPAPISGASYEDVLNHFTKTMVVHPDKAIAYPYPILLEGKSYENPPGGQDMIEFLFWVNKVAGQRESPDTQIIYTLCYPYKTIFSNPVCIDADPFDMDPRKKVCTSKTEIFSTGQGAPVTITKVEPFMSKVGPTIRPSFRIYMQNTGDGSVLRLNPTDGLTHQQRCHAENMDLLDWNKVSIKAELSGKELECLPETVLLKTMGAASHAVCRLKEEDVYDEEFAQGSNYKANLNIELDYIYMSTAVHRLQILRET